MQANTTKTKTATTAVLTVTALYLGVDAIGTVEAAPSCAVCLSLVDELHGGACNACHADAADAAECDANDEHAATLADRDAADFAPWDFE